MPAVKRVIDKKSAAIMSKSSVEKRKRGFRSNNKRKPSLKSMHITFYKEEDGSITGVLEELDLIENEKTKEECVKSLIAAMKDYAADFYNDLEFWGNSTNRKTHISYVMEIMALDQSEIKDILICQDGKN